MNEREKIIIFTAFYEPWMSGAERFVKEVVERLGSRYHFVLYTSRLSRTVTAFEDRGDFEIRRVGFGFKFDKWLFPILAPLAALGTRAKIAHAVMESYAGIALWVFGLLRPRTKRILTLQSGDLDSDIKQRKIPNWLWRRIHRSPHLVTAISRFLAERALRLGAAENEVVILPNGVDLARFTPRAASERVRQRIVCVARLSWEKGHTHLLKAFAEIKPAYPDAELWLVGDGALKNEIAAEAASLGIAEAVIFKGNLPNDEAMRVVKIAEVFVCPSLAEGLGIVFIEAQAAGVPAIGTKVGGIPDVIEDGVTGLTVPPADPAALAAAIRKIFNDQELAARLVTEALNRLPRFDWRTIVEQMAGCYEALLTRPIVVLAASVYPPDIGGPGSVAAEFANGWTRAGGRVYLVAPAEKDSLGFENGFRLERVAKTRGRYAYFRAVYSRARRSDLVFVQDASLVSLAALAAARLARVPLVVRLGGELLWERDSEAGRTKLTLSEYFSSGAWRNAPLKYRIFLRVILGSAKRLIFPSAWLTELYEKAGLLASGKSEIVLNPAPKIASSERAEKIRQVIIAGRLIKLKNIIPALEALSAVRGEVEPFSVLVIGEGPEKAAIQKWKEEQAAEWLAIRGVMPRTELLAELGRSALYLLVSTSEVSPNSAVESLAAGTPVVLTEANGLAGELGNFVYLVNPSDPAALRAVLKKALSAEGRADAIARLAGFSWPQSNETMIAAYEKIFRDVCAF